MNSAKAPSARQRACAVWTGDEMFVWGGANAAGESLDTGGAYDPMTDTWREVTMDAPPTAREQAVCLAFEERVFVWGGVSTTTPGSVVAPRHLLDGAIWMPQTNGWRAIAAPPVTLLPRIRTTAVWTGEKILIWGGEDLFGGQVASGALYDPQDDVWTEISTLNMPPLNKRQAAVWTSAELYVFGGRDNGGGHVNAKFHRYSPTSDEWSEVLTEGKPTVRSNAFAVWTGSNILIWGGLNKDGVGLIDGAAYDPTADQWTPLSDVAPPTARGREQFRSGWTTWTNEEMFIVGGSDNNGVQADLARLDPDASSPWTTDIAWDPPLSHEGGVGVWTNQEFILWGGSNGSDPIVSGTRWMP